MKLASDKEGGWKRAAPHRVAWGAFLLADDILHERITKAAEKAEAKTGLSRKALASSVVGAGTVATCAILSPEPLLAASFAPVGALVFLLYRRMIGKAMELKAASGAVAQSAESMLMKAARLPLLAFGLLRFVSAELEGRQGAAAYGIYFTSLAVAAYLASGGNGMLEKMRSFFHEAAASLLSRPAAEVPAGR